MFAALLILSKGHLFANTIDPDRFETEVLVNSAADPMQMQVLPDGRVYFIERTGALKLYDPVLPGVRLLGTVPVSVYVEVGLMGLAIAPDFEESALVYLMYCPADDPDVLRIGRFSVADDRLHLKDAEVVLEYPIDRKEAVHMGGGLWMTAGGDLYIGTGDNTVPIAELPVDQRPGEEYRDAMRTSANSNDLRGKILRIRPEADGSYSIPDGNLFPDGRGGRPEIFAIGCRNPFRLCVDEQVGAVFWGDVGPNISMAVDIGPNGYDEINRAASPGNYGWPMFVGPNEAYRDYDFDTGQLGLPFDAGSPINLSRNNTGIERLPPARPALIWYPSTDSKDFPSLGSGGRSAMASLVYRDRDDFDPLLKMPESMHGKLVIHDWMRNWIKTVKLDETGKLVQIEDFMPGSLFRRPMQLALRSDGTLYLMEYGDKWGGNRDGQISRIVYRRGNRAPTPAFSLHPEGGKEPLDVRFDATASADRDPGDKLSFTWSINSDPVTGGDSAEFSKRFEEAGRFDVELTVRDSNGATSTASQTLHIGNDRPDVTLLEPSHGGFFDWGQVVKYRVEARDDEDGSTDERTITADRITGTVSYRTRRHSGGESAFVPEGLALMRKSACFGCHAEGSTSGGPPYRQVAVKYANDSSAVGRLAEKVLKGGSGVWGNKIMPPHPQHSPEELRLMIEWVLGLATDRSDQLASGTHGAFHAPRDPMDPRARGGLLLLNFGYTDDGFEEAPPIRTEVSRVLHARRKRIAYSDELHGVQPVEVFEGQEGAVAAFGDGGYVVVRDVDLTGIGSITCRHESRGSGVLELRSSHVSGPLIAAVPIGDATGQGGFQELTVPIPATEGLGDLVVAARSMSQDKGFATSVAWIEFHAAAHAPTENRKVVLIPVAPEADQIPDNVRKTCEVLAHCLNRQPGVVAIVSPEEGWPGEHSLIANARSVVFCGADWRSAPEPLASLYRERVEMLAELGVGVTEIAFAAETSPDDDQTGSLTLDGNTGPESVIADWIPEVFHGPVTAPKPNKTSQSFMLASLGSREVPAGWSDDPSDQGRHVLIGIGDARKNLASENYRRLLIQTVLWTAREPAPSTGADVWIEPHTLRGPRGHVQRWTVDDLEALLPSELEEGAFARGKMLFSEATCGACHRMNHRGGRLGPELTEVFQRMAKQPDPRHALLTELLEPSAVVAQEYRMTTLVLASGKVVSGVVLAEDEHALTLCTDAANPDNTTQVSLADIEERSLSDVSLMPEGLLDSFTHEEIHELLVYLEAGGNRRHEVYAAKKEGASSP